MNKLSASSLSEVLTERELEVLRLAADGLSNGEIAERLVISLGTVKWHATQIYDKLGVKSRTQAIALAQTLGILSQGSATPPRTTDGASASSLFNFPLQRSPFVGRELELHRIAGLLADPTCRLLTLVGPGGMGKTSLALEVGRRYGNLFPDGVGFITLTPLSSPDDIVTMTANNLSFQFKEGEDPKRQLMVFLRSRRMLLIMDNFDELLSGADVVLEMLAAAPHVKILVTSRERLNLQQENLLRIDGLPPPSAETPGALRDNAAIALFVQSARRARPDYQPNDDELRDIANLCWLLDGMPLGILLATPWIEVLTPAEIVREVETNLDFLETQMRDIPERHRSIRVIFESAWNRLTETERGVFTRLSTLRGDFSREAAQTVAGATLPTLMSLANKSLLRRDADGRYEIHELIRQYAVEQLELSGSADETYGAHGRYFLDFVQRQYAEVEARGLRAVSIYDADMENIRAAWAWAVSHGDYAAIGPASESFSWLWTRRGRHWDALKMFDYAIEEIERQTSANASDVHLHLRECRGKILTLTGDFDSAIADLQFVRQAAHDAGDFAREQSIFVALGQTWRRADRPQEATRYLNLALGKARERNDQHTVADILFHLGTVAWDEGDNLRARACYDEALAISRRLHFTDYVIVQALHGRGETSFGSAQPSAAFDFYSESLELARHIGDQPYEAENLQMMGWAAIGLVGTGDYALAQRLLAESLEISVCAGLEWHTMCSIIGLGLTQGSRGDFEQGIANVRAGIAIAESLRIARMLTVGLDSLGTLLQDLGLLDKAIAAHQRGIDVALNAENAFWMPRLQANLAIDRLRLGDLTVGPELEAALKLATENGQLFHALRCLEGLAEFAAAVGDAASLDHWADALREAAERSGLREMRAQAHRWHGEAELLSGKVEAAQVELERAIEIAEAIDRPFLISQLHAALARCARACGQEADAQRHEAQKYDIDSRIFAPMRDKERHVDLLEVVASK